MAQRPPIIENTDEVGSSLVDAPAGEVTNADRRNFLAASKRELSEEEAASPAGRRWLLAELDRLDTESTEYKALQAQHNDLRVKVARLEEAQKTSKWTEILSFVSVSIGSAGIGAAPSFVTVKELATAGWTMAILSSVLVIVGILAKVFRS